MPQLDKFIFFPQLFWFVVLLAGLYLLLVGWLLPRLLRSLKFRRAHRGRLARRLLRSSLLLADRLPPLVAPSQRSPLLVLPALDRLGDSLAFSLSGFRRFLLPPLPLRPFPLASLASLPSLSQLPVFSPLFSAPPAAPASLAPLTFHGRSLSLPPFYPRPSPSTPVTLSSTVSSLVPLPPSLALLLLALAARQIQRELLLWLDPLAVPLPLEELALLSLRGLARSPLIRLPSLLS